MSPIPHRPSHRQSRRSVLWSGAALAALSFAALAEPALAAEGRLQAVGIENQYADVIAQVGGRYVDVRAIMSNPNTDPHEFEASPTVAREIAKADLVVENGLGYDDWADKILAAAPNPKRVTINVQHLLKLPGDTPNPHLWYDPKTMPAVAMAVADALAKADPDHAAAFKANARKFDASLDAWRAAIAAFRKDYPDTPVAVTEPVADDLVTALGAKRLTPEALEMAAMNDTDPSPQDVARQEALFTGHKVKVFLYNQQVTDALTDRFLKTAKARGIPVVSVYETMPEPGFTYQSWMLAETRAIRKAVADGVSTEKLVAGR